MEYFVHVSLRKLKFFRINCMYISTLELNNQAIYLCECSLFKNKNYSKYNVTDVDEVKV